MDRDAQKLNAKGLITFLLNGIDFEYQLQDNFIDKYLDLLTKQPQETSLDDYVGFIKLLETLMQKTNLKLPDTCIEKLLDLFITHTKKGDKCNSFIFITEFIELHTDKNEKFSYNKKYLNKKYLAKFLNLLAVNQHHYNLDQLIEYFKYVFDNGGEFSEENEQIVLSFLAGQIKTNKMTQSDKKMFIEGLIKKNIISDDFVNKLLDCLMGGLHFKDEARNDGMITTPSEYVIIEYIIKGYSIEIKNKRKHLETIINKQIQNPNFILQLFVNFITNSSLGELISHAKDKNYEINISEQSLKIFFDLFIKVHSYLLGHNLSYKEADFNNLYLLIDFLFNCCEKNTDSIDDNSEIKYYAISSVLQLINKLFSTKGMDYYEITPQKTYTDFIKWLKTFTILSPIKDITIFNKIQLSCDQIGLVNRKNEIIKILNLKQIECMKDNCNADRCKLVEFLENSNKIYGKLLRISVDKPFTALPFTQYIIKDCEDKVIGVFPNKDLPGFFVKVDNDNYEMKLLEERKNFLVKYLAECEKYSEFLKNDDKIDKYIENIKKCLQDTEGQLKKKIESEESNKKNLDYKKINLDDTVSIAPSTTQSTAGLIKTEIKSGFTLRSCLKQLHERIKA